MNTRNGSWAGGALLAVLLSACSAQSSAQQLVGQFWQPCGPKLTYLQPVWSPGPGAAGDGQMIAFYSDNGESRLYVMHTNGRGQLVLDIDSPGTIDRPAWSPDGQQLAISLHHRLAVVSVDGTDLAQLVDTNSPETDSLPDWSPDGTQIMFLSIDKDRRTTINVINADGTGRKRLAESNTNTWVWPSWSPDGTRILFKQVDDDGLESIAVVDRDGNVTRLTAPARYYHGAAWSPDGKRIVYAFGTQADNSRLFVMDSDGGNADLLTNFNIDGAAGPEWSPDGERIAFSLTTLQRLPTIFVINTDGTNVTELSLGWAGGFSWSPDSVRIANSGGSLSDIYLIDAAGGNVRQFTQNPASRSCLRWPF